MEIMSTSANYYHTGVLRSAGLHIRLYNISVCLYFTDSEKESNRQNKTKALDIRYHCSCIKDKVSPVPSSTVWLVSITGPRLIQYIDFGSGKK